MEPNYAELGVYIFFGGLVVQSIFRIFDPIIDMIRSWFIPRDKKEKEVGQHLEEQAKEHILNGESVMVSTHYYDGKDTQDNAQYFPPYYPIYPDPHAPKKIKKPVKYTDIIIPPIVGLLVVWIFLPATIFDYLPFQPRYPVLAIVITALIISRIANAEYDTFKTIGEFFIGITGRFFR